MKANLLNTLIIVFVTTGTAIIPIVGDASAGAEPLKNLFLAFVAAIVAIQLIPAVVLFGCVLKPAFARRDEEQENGATQ